MRLLVCLLLCVGLGQVSARAETIHYRIKQIGITVGEATLEFAGPKEFKNHKTEAIVFRAKGLDFFDEENIYISTKDYKPLFVERDLNIFGKKEHILENYETKPGDVYITKRKDGKVTHQTLKVGGKVDNIYAFIYRYRKEGDFKIGDTIDVRLPTNTMKIKLVRREHIWAGHKKYECYFMESDPSKYKIWFDASEKKLPLRISGAVGLANTTMIMSSYKE